MAVSKDREKALEAALAQIDKQYGKGSVMRLGDDRAPIETIPTSSIAMDTALGIGGFPAAASWRSTARVLRQDHRGAARHRQAQKTGGIAAFIDAEHALDPEYAEKLGRRYRRPAGLPAGHR